MTISPPKHTSPLSNWSDNTVLIAAIFGSLIFTALIWILRPIFPYPDFLPDAGYAWYYWKLPEPTVMSRATAWGGYILHQVFMWVIIFIAQRSNLKYQNRLHRLNWIALGGNALFIILHFIQTGIWYDGLAQDTTVTSSQGSVILLIVLVLLMENDRRGLFFGKKVPGLTRPASVVKYYHGYIFVWATIYTFWFHPMESSISHLMGFLHTFFLMVQGSLFFTRAHLNKYWMLTNEIVVLFHGTIVAVMNGIREGRNLELWSMFFFGFGAIFIITQLYGLGLSRRMRWFFNLLFLGLILITYNGRWADMNEIIRIPMIEYLLVFVIALLLWVGIKIKDFVRPT